MSKRAITVTASVTFEALRGRGQHSHPVPSVEGRVILMRDGNHSGTEIYRVEGGFRFVGLDLGGSVETAERCVLVALGDLSVDDLEAPFGCDLDSPKGLALVGISADDDLSQFAAGEVIWDSAALA
jgi:hypothetical protein